MIRAVIDTNVLVSAMISSSGNEALVLLAVDLKLLSPCFSVEILQEYEDVLRRPKFGFELVEIERLLDLFRSQGGDNSVLSHTPDFSRSRRRQIHCVCTISTGGLPGYRK